MTPLLGLDVQEIREAIGRAEPAFRARQVYRAIYRERVADLASVSTLPLPLRRRLAGRWEVGWPALERRFDSADGTRRYLLRLADGRTVETVLMPEAARQTICISTQVGCPVGCKFCMTALLGLERNLTAGEIVGQVLYVARANRSIGDWLGCPPVDTPASPRFSRINIVMMGQGEPLLNLPNVLKATRLLTDPEGVGISVRRITLSTVGLVPELEDLGRAEVRPKLAVSLNASTDEVRRRLIPLARRYPLGDLLAACRRYPLRPWERLTFEYVLIKGVNDSDADARRLVRLLANLKCKVNLIPLNPGREIPFQPPERERVLAFQAIVRRGIPCFVRQARGQDVFAACGQLSRQGQINEPASVAAWRRPGSAPGPT